jgi:hypothetical protein
MPYPGKNESKGDFISRAIKTFMDEGYSQKESVGRAYGFWRHYKNQRKPKVIVATLSVRN